MLFLRHNIISNINDNIIINIISNDIMERFGDKPDGLLVRRSICNVAFVVQNFQVKLHHKHYFLNQTNTSSVVSNEHLVASPINDGLFDTILAVSATSETLSHKNLTNTDLLQV